MWNLANTYLRVLAKVVILSLSLPIFIHPGYGSISFEHESLRVTATETETKVLDGAREK